MYRAACCLLVAICAPAQDLRFEGTVTDAATKQPMAGVELHLRSMGQQSGILHAYGARSDSKGHFVMGDIVPGPYNLWAETKGFISVPKKSAGPMGMVQIKAGQSITDHQVEMIGRAAIRGRVVDERGEPVARAIVSAERVGDPVTVGTKRFNNGINADERGMFRMAVYPGQYRVLVRAQNNMGGREVITDGSPATVYPQTYYPSAVTREQAGVVDVPAGGDSPEIEVRLSHSGPARGLTISGVVQGADPRNSFVMLLRSMTAGQMGSPMAGQSMAQADGSFSFPHVEPGRYTIVANSQGKSAVPLEVTVDRADLTGVTLRMVESAPLRGILAVEGDPPGPLKDSWRVNLEASGPIMTGSGTTLATVNSDGTFQLAKVAPGRFRVQVKGPTPDAYVASATIDGGTTADDLVTFQGGDSVLQVKARRQGGRIRGKVKDGSGVVQENVPLAVILVAEDDDLSRPKFTSLKADGSFEFRGIRPGKYRLMPLASFSQMNLQERLKAMMASLPQFEVKDRDVIERDVTMVNPEVDRATSR